MTTLVGIGDMIAMSGSGESARPVIADTGISVARISVLHSRGWTPDQIREDVFDAVSLAQIHAAIAYYYANREAIDSWLVDEERAYDRAAEASAQTR